MFDIQVKEGDGTVLWTGQLPVIPPEGTGIEVGDGEVRVVSQVAWHLAADVSDTTFVVLWVSL